MTVVDEKSLCQRVLSADGAHPIDADTASVLARALLERIEAEESQQADTCPPRESGIGVGSATEPLIVSLPPAGTDLPTEAERGVFTANTAYVAEHVPAEQHGAYAPAHIWGLVRAIRRAKPQAGVVDAERLAALIESVTIRDINFPHDVTITAGKNIELRFGPESARSIADALIASGLIRAVPSRETLAKCIEDNIAGQAGICGPCGGHWPNLECGHRGRPDACIPAVPDGIIPLGYVP